MKRNEEIQNLKDVLIRRREALRSALAGDLSLFEELRGETHGDLIDFALEAAQDEISSQVAEVESRELRNIETALQNMRNGTYGCCEHCEDSIPLARLQALPYATLCIRCQRESEKGGPSRTKANWGRVVDDSSDDREIVVGHLD